MLRKNFLNLMLAIFSVFLQSAWAEDKSTALLTTIPDSTSKIIKLTDKGLVPQTLNMTTQDSIVFLLNDSSDSLATVEVDFGAKHMHCNGSNLRADSDGKVRSSRPFGPRDFAATCFHEPGDFPYKVFGLSSNPAGFSGMIHVE